LTPGPTEATLDAEAQGMEATMPKSHETESARGKTYLSPRQAAERLPGRPSERTVTRWITRGLPAPDGGGRVHLAAERVSGRWYIRPRALASFLGKIRPPTARAADREAASRAPRNPRPVRPSTKDLEHRLARAQAECEALGLG